jgi:hypothetical protein
MKNNNLKYISFGISIIILIFTFIQPFRLIDIINSTSHFFEIYMSFSISIIEQVLISSVPILVYYLNKKNGSLELKTISIQIIIIYLSLLIFFIVSVYFITLFPNLKSPLIPENFISEPFELYFTLIVFLGILIPVKIINNRIKS